MINIQANRTSSQTSFNRLNHGNFHPISSLSDTALSNLENNYIKRRVTTGGIYPLSNVRAEKLRRISNGLSGEELCQLILDLSQVNADGFTTYLDLYRAIFPAKAWCGHTSIRTIMRVLHEIIIYCVENSLPLVTALVVRSDTRQLSPEALQNIYDCAGDMGVDVGPNVDEFVTNQILNAFNLFDTERTLH